MNEASLKAKARELYRKWRDGEASGVDMLEQALREGAAMKPEQAEPVKTAGGIEAEKLIRDTDETIHWLYEPKGGFHLRSASNANRSCAKLMREDVATLIDLHRAEAERAAIERCAKVAEAGNDPQNPNEYRRACATISSAMRVLLRSVEAK